MHPSQIGITLSVAANHRPRPGLNQQKSPVAHIASRPLHHCSSVLEAQPAIPLPFPLIPRFLSPPSLSPSFYPLLHFTLPSLPFFFIHNLRQTKCPLQGPSATPLHSFIVSACCRPSFTTEIRRGRLTLFAHPTTRILARRIP